MTPILFFDVTHQSFAQRYQILSVQPECFLSGFNMMRWILNASSAVASEEYIFGFRIGDLGIVGAITLFGTGARQ